MKLIRTSLTALVLAAAGRTAFAEPTEIVAHVISRDAKFVGSSTHPRHVARKKRSFSMHGRTWALSLAVLAASLAPSAYADPLHVYSPGGPAPALREAGEAFQRQTGRAVSITAGPPGQWLEQARSDADIIVSGSETMMTDLAASMGGQVDLASAQPLYLRAAAILVRPGNPEAMTGFESLLAPGRRILVVNGAGQTGLWEDIAGRTGDIETVRLLRQNIVVQAANSAEARQAWIDDQSLDVWLTWTIWQWSNPGLADVVELGEGHAIYRDAGAALTARGADDADAAAFIAFLRGPDGAQVFARWGWIGEAGP
jgi:accessory colonization factor AcfC